MGNEILGQNLFDTPEGDWLYSACLKALSHRFYRLQKGFRQAFCHEPWRNWKFEPARGTQSKVEDYRQCVLSSAF